MEFGIRFQLRDFSFITPFTWQMLELSAIMWNYVVDCQPRLLPVEIALLAWFFPLQNLHSWSILFYFSIFVQGYACSFQQTWSEILVKVPFFAKMKGVFWNGRFCQLFGWLDVESPKKKLLDKFYLQKNNTRNCHFDVVPFKVLLP